MSKEFVDGAGAFGRIRSFIRKKYGTQRKCARALGISEGHLSDMLNSRCEISPILLAAAGLVRRVVYEVRELPEMKADESQTAAERRIILPAIPSRNTLLAGMKKPALPIIHAEGWIVSPTALAMIGPGPKWGMFANKPPFSAILCPVVPGPKRTGSSRL